jgi:hypothetical protein
MSATSVFFPSEPSFIPFSFRVVSPVTTITMFCERLRHLCAFFISQCEACHKVESAYFNMIERLFLPSVGQIGNVSQLIFNSYLFENVCGRMSAGL